MTRSLVVVVEQGQVVNAEIAPRNLQEAWEQIAGKLQMVGQTPGNLRRGASFVAFDLADRNFRTVDFARQFALRLTQGCPPRPHPLAEGGCGFH